jgi:hypothetical protein
MPGASHSFLRQICEPEAHSVRDGIEAALARLSPELRESLQGRLSSLDNRAFFQGFAELATADALRRVGWQIGLGSDGRRLRGIRPGGSSCKILVLGFIHSQRPEMDQEGVRKLIQALERVSTTLRFAVFLRRWLPPNFDPEPVRRAVELWLGECEDGAWDGTQAAYEDEGVALEFKLSGGSIRDGQSPISLTIGPFVASRVMMVLEQRVILALDRDRLVSGGDESVLVAAVADQPWQLSRGYVREFLYGKPRFMTTATGGDQGPQWEAGLSPDQEPCLFKDPVYRSVTGVMLLERLPSQALRMRGRGYSNPFAIAPINPQEAPGPMLHRHRSSEGLPVMRWEDVQPSEFTVGARY